jgi:hypothetical protein
MVIFPWEKRLAEIMFLNEPVRDGSQGKDGKENDEWKRMLSDW